MSLQKMNTSSTLSLLSDDDVVKLNDSLLNRNCGDNCVYAGLSDDLLKRLPSTDSLVFVSGDGRMSPSRPSTPALTDPESVESGEYAEMMRTLKEQEDDATARVDEYDTDSLCYTDRTDMCYTDRTDREDTARSVVIEVLDDDESCDSNSVSYLADLMAACRSICDPSILSRQAKESSTEGAATPCAAMTPSSPRMVAPAAVRPIFAKGQRVLYRSPFGGNGTCEEMEVVGVHVDECSTLYYTVQQLEPGFDGICWGKQTDPSRLTAIEMPRAPACTPTDDYQCRDEVSNSIVLPPLADELYDHHPNTPVTPSTASTQKLSPRKMSLQVGSYRRQQSMSSSASDSFTVIVSLGDSRSFFVPGVSPRTTVGDVKRFMGRQLGLSPQYALQTLRFIYGNKVVSTTCKTMADLGISEGARIGIVSTAYWYI
jgi:hypothetical protein